MKVIEIPIKDVVVKAHRRLDVEYVKELAQSIKNSGLRHPISVNKLPDGKYLSLGGGHRVEAYKLLKREFIPATVEEVDEVDAELIGIEENLLRKDLTKLERDLSIKRREELLKEKGERAKRGRQNKCDTVSHLKKTKDLAKENRLSARSIQRAIKNVKDLAPEAILNIINTDVANSPGEYSKLVKLPSELQIEVTNKIKTGECSSIKKAIGRLYQLEREKKYHGTPFPLVSEIKLFTGDCREQPVEKESVDLCLTDIPYLTENAPEWHSYANWIHGGLKPGGYCITYAGQYHLYKIAEAFLSKFSSYWVIACIHQGRCARFQPRKVICCWKPILVFAKESIKSQERYFRDVLDVGKREKSDHKWQQSVAEAEKLIEIFSKPGDLILDPFAGSGTTAIAAIKKKRRFIGIDIDPECIKTTELRIKELHAGIEKGGNK